jgi:DNA-binding PadR family transcriptional regulator
MDVLEALGGWSNINREKLDQIKVDNPPLYNAITKALNLLAKKYGGEDIVIQKPIEVVEEKATTIQTQAESYYDFLATDYAFLKRMEILNLGKVNAVTSSAIVNSMMQGINGYISITERYELYVQQRLDDLEARGLVSRIAGSIYKISDAGQALIDSYELQNKQVEELTPIDEDLKLEILLRMADYYDGGVYKLLNQDDIIKYAVKHTFSIPSNKYFGLVVKLLQDGFVEKDPSGDTDSIRLTNQGYDKAMGWFEENLPEEEIATTPPSSQATTQLSEEDRYMNILKTILICKIKFGQNPNLAESYKEFRLTNVVPITYEIVDMGNNNPNFLADLSKLNDDGLIEINYDKENSAIYEVTLKGNTMLQNYLKSKGQFNDFISEIEVLSAQSKTNQPTSTPAQAQLTDLQVSILEAVEEASSRKVGDEFVKIVDIWPYIMGNMPINYAVYQDNLTPPSPSLQQDLQLLESKGYLQFAQSGLDARDYKYMLRRKGIEFLSDKKVKTTPTPPTPQTNLRPSPTFSATKYATGVTMVGNDMSLWRVTENKNGVKRWVKVGEPQYDLPQDRLKGVLKVLSEAISKTNDYVTISEFYTQLYSVNLPVNYTKFGLSGEPSLEKDLEVMERMGLVKSRKTTLGTEYYVDTKGGEMLTQLKFEEAQKQKPQILAQAQITKTPEFSQEPPISEIEEDEVDLDILEQQLNDDSLEFDISDEDLDNLEF